MTHLILPTVFLLNFYVTINFALQINLYTSMSEIKQEVSLINGYFETYLTNEEYTAIIPGTIDFSGEKILEQDLYSTNERLRNTIVYIRSTKCGDTSSIASELVDPYRLLVQSGLLGYSYVLREQIQFPKEPLFDRSILSFRLDNTLLNKTNMTYLTRGLWWALRYEVNIINEQSATLRALADIHNEHERSYDVTHSQLIIGRLPLTIPSPVVTSYTTNLDTYSYNLTRQFKLYPKSIKTYPFLTPTIISNYTFEAIIDIQSGTKSGLFQRVFVLQASEFLPAGIATFYLQKTGTYLGQSRLIDAAKNTEQKFYLDTDPDVKYTIKHTREFSHDSSYYGHYSNMNVVFSNQNDKQTAIVTLTIYHGDSHPKVIMKNSSSPSITVVPTSSFTLTTQGMIKPNQEESCSFTLQSQRN